MIRVDHSPDFKPARTSQDETNLRSRTDFKDDLGRKPTTLPSIAHISESQTNLNFVKNQGNSPGDIVKHLRQRENDKWAQLVNIDILLAKKEKLESMLEQKRKNDLQKHYLDA
jgi:hypothetical protein